MLVYLNYAYQLHLLLQILIHNEKVHKVDSLQDFWPKHTTRLQPRGQWPTTEELEQQTQQSLHHAGLQSVPRPTRRIGQLLQQSCGWLHQGPYSLTQPINWSEWSGRIITEGLVERVKNNYEAQSAQEYDLDKIFTDVFSRDSKAIDEIVHRNLFRTAKWPSTLPFGSTTTCSTCSSSATWAPSLRCRTTTQSSGATCIPAKRPESTPSSKLTATSQEPTTTSTCGGTWSSSSLGARECTPSTSTPPKTSRTARPPRTPWVVDYKYPNINGKIELNQKRSKVAKQSKPFSKPTETTLTISFSLGSLRFISFIKQSNLMSRLLKNSTLNEFIRAICLILSSRVWIFYLN